jgi:hypothetical protein
LVYRKFSKEKEEEKEMTEETNSPKEVITTFEQWWALHGQGMARVQVLTMWHLEKVAHCAWNASKQLNQNKGA